jgi:hypothetical protein
MVWSYLPEAAAPGVMFFGKNFTKKNNIGENITKDMGM